MDKTEKNLIDSVSVKDFDWDVRVRILFIHQQLKIKSSE